MVVINNLKKSSKMFLNSFITFSKRTLFIFFSKIFSYNNKIKKRYCYVIYEVFVRDFVHRSFIACKLAEKGFTVFLVPNNKFYKISEILPKGIFFTKSIENNLRFSNAISRHNCYVYQEEQLGLNHKDSIEVKQKVNNLNLKKIKKIFLWGQAMKRGYLYNPSYKKYKNIFSVVGSTKFDLLKNKNFIKIYQPERDWIKNKFKNYIIMMSNFGFATDPKNKFKNPNLVSEYWGVKPNKKFYESWKEYIKFKEKNCKSFIKLYYFLKKNYPNYKVLIRPHPADNLDFWNKKVDRNDVVTKYTSIPWILDSKFVIHHYCTTSIEAFFLRNNNSICFSPHKNGGYFENIYFKTSHFAKNYTQIDQLLKNDNNSLDFTKKDINEFNFNIRLNKKFNISTKKIVTTILKDNIKSEMNFDIFMVIKFMDLIYNLTFGLFNKYRKVYKVRQYKLNKDININNIFKTFKHTKLIQNNLKFKEIYKDSFLIQK
jgi:surface carbohydrate biosynthesis protein